MQMKSDYCFNREQRTNNLNPKILQLMGLGLITASVFADDLQYKLMSIASKEAQIAGIGANKVNMLYGTNNPIPIINRWNELENHPKLTSEQIDQINALEKTKQQYLQEHK